MSSTSSVHCIEDECHLSCEENLNALHQKSSSQSTMCTVAHYSRITSRLQWRRLQGDKSQDLKNHNFFCLDHLQQIFHIQHILKPALASIHLCQAISTHIHPPAVICSESSKQLESVLKLSKTCFTFATHPPCPTSTAIFFFSLVTTLPCSCLPQCLYLHFPILSFPCHKNPLLSMSFSRKMTLISQISNLTTHLASMIIPLYYSKSIGNCMLPQNKRFYRKVDWEPAIEYAAILNCSAKVITNPSTLWLYFKSLILKLIKYLSPFK